MNAITSVIVQGCQAAVAWPAGSEWGGLLHTVRASAALQGAAWLLA